MKYLDKTGLSLVWNKIIEKLNFKVDITNNEDNPIMFVNNEDGKLLYVSGEYDTVRIGNIDNPIDNQDVATKSYVDNNAVTAIAIPSKEYEIPQGSYDLRIVGPSSISGDIRAGQYYILDVTSMRKVVGAEEQEAENTEYLGTIEWEIESEDIELDVTNNGTQCNVNIINSTSNSFTIYAYIIDENGNEYDVQSYSATAEYAAADYLISSFSDLQNIETCISNKTESSITVTKNEGSTYTPTDGGGFEGARFRFTKDIYCGGSHVEIGNYNTSTNKTQYFAGYIDGAGYSLLNIGGNCGVAGAASSGGETASCLIRHGKNCTVSNLYLYGDVTNIASRGMAPVITMVEGTCYCKGIYNGLTMKCASDVASGETTLVGWSVSEGNCILSNCVFAGSIEANYSITGFNACPCTIDNCVNLGSQKTIITTRGTVNMQMIGGNNTVSTNCFAIAKCFIAKSATSTLDSVKAQLVTINYKSITNSYENVLYNILVNYQNWKYVEPASGITATNSYSVNGLDGATAVTVKQLKRLQLDDSGFICSEGFMPVLQNSQFAVDSLMLSRIRNGFTE